MNRPCRYANCTKLVGEVASAFSRVERSAREDGFCSATHFLLEKERVDKILRELARDAEELGTYD